jgi:hypothetical protein
MSQSKPSSQPITLSEQGQRSFAKTMEEANHAIEQTRAQIIRSRALSQSEADLAREIDSLNDHHDRFTRTQKDRD